MTLKCIIRFSMCYRILNRLLINSRPVTVNLSTTPRQGGNDKAASPDSGPIKFTNSKAASWSLAKTVIQSGQDIPWYQPISVAISLSVFLIYFLCLREENDLDMKLNSSLFEHVPQLEESQVKLALEYSYKDGKDTKELEERLVQLQQRKETGRVDS